MSMFSGLFVQVLLRLEVFRVLDGADFYVGVFTVFI
jgi:hypothetical protein